MDDWKPKKLGDLCDFVRGPFGGSLKKSCFVDDGFAVYEQQHAIKNQFKEIRYFVDRKKFDEMQRFELFPGDLIMSCSGTMGKTAIVPNNIPKGIINQALLKLTVKGELIVEFLKHWMESPDFQMQLGKYSKGVAIKNVASVKVLKNIKVALPSLPEQKRIVAILDDTFAGITQAVTNAEKNLANARELFESYLNSVFTQKGEGWVSTTLGNEIDLLTGFAFRSKGYTDSQDGLKLLRGDNIVQGSFRWVNVKNWPIDDVDAYSQYYLAERDVVLAMDRTWVKAGLKYAQISRNDLPCLLVQRVARLRAKKDFDDVFLKYLIGSGGFTRYVLSIQTGSGVPHISGTQIKSFAFFKPSMSEQKDISIKLDELRRQIQRLETIYQKTQRPRRTQTVHPSKSVHG